MRNISRDKFRIGFSNPAISARIIEQHPGTIAITGPAARPGHWNAFGEVKALVYHAEDAPAFAAVYTMLEALEAALVALLKVNGKNETRFEICMVRDAIAEATGQDPEKVEQFYERFNT